MGTRRRRTPLRASALPLLGLVSAIVLLAVLAAWLLRLLGIDLCPAPEPDVLPAASTEEAPGGAPPDTISLPGRVPAPGVTRVGVGSLERSVAARLAAEPVRTSPVDGPIRISLSDLEWDDPRGRPFFRADSVRATLDGGALGSRDVRVVEAALHRPELYLARGSDEVRWNYEDALAGLTGREAGAAARPAAGARWTVELLDVTVEGGLVEVRPPGPDVFRFLNVDAEVSRAALAVPGEPVAATVARLSTTVVWPGFEERIPVRVLAAEVRFPREQVEFAAARLEAAASVATAVAGAYSAYAPGPGLELEARVERLAFRDARLLLPDLPETGEAMFDLEVEALPGERTAVRLDALVARSGTSRVEGAAALALGPGGGVRPLSADLRLDPVALDLVERFTGPIPYEGLIRGTIRGEDLSFVFDLTARLASPAVAEPFTAALSGTIAFAEEAFSLARLDVALQNVPLAAFRPLVPALPLAEARISGRITVRGPPGRVPLELDVDLGVAGGAVAIAGTLDLTGPAVSYDLRGRVIGVRLDEILEPEIPPVALVAGFTLVGTGTGFATAHVYFALDGRFTGWEAGPADSVRVRGALAGGTLTLDDAMLRLATLAFGAGGIWRFVEPSRGGLDYRVAVRDLEPFVPYIPGLAGDTAAGAIRTVGTLDGTLEEPRLTGRLEGGALAYDGWSADTLTARYTVRFGDALPVLRVRAAASAVLAPNGLLYDTATASLTLADSRFDVDLRAERASGGGLVLVADGRIQEDGTRDALLRRLELDLDGDEWRLERPARLRWGAGNGILVQGLVIRETEGMGRVAVDGQLMPVGAEPLFVEIAALPLAEIQRFVGLEPQISGQLWAEIRAVGPPDRPRIGADFRLLEGGVPEFTIARVEGALLYEASRLTAEATALLDSVNAVTLDASLPVAVELSGLPSVRLLETAPLRATLRADSLPLEVLAAATPAIRDAEGLLRASIRITGSPDAPALDGTIQVRNGEVTIPDLNRRYEAISADVVLEDRRAWVRELRARSDGWATVTGTVTFPTLTDPVVDLLIELDGFRAIGADELEGAAAWGELRVAGPAAAPVVTGDVTLDDGYVVVPSFGQDGLTDPRAGEPSPLEPVGTPEAAPAPWLEAVAFDEVVVEAGEALWFVLGESRAQLSGELVLVKEVGESIRIFGSLVGERGTFILRAGPIVRRFDIIRAEIQFFGTPDPNPALDILASRVVPGASGELIEIQIRIEGTADAPTVALTTPQGATVPESELLSLLLFGQPAFALAEGGPAAQPLLEEALFGVGSLAEIASIELEEALVADLGLPLDFLQIRPAPGPFVGFGAPTLVFGSQIDDDLFLTVNAPLAGVFGTAAAPGVWTATLEWRIDPEWSLELGVAPIHRRRFPFGIGPIIPVTNPEQQFIIELRRRWTY